MKYTLRKYQEDAVKSGLDFLQGNEKGGAIIVAPSGCGKSLIIASIAHKLKGNTLVLQPSAEIVFQNYEKMVSYVGEEDIGIYSASAGRKDINKITFATIGSIIHKKHLFDDFQNLIIDECFVAGTKIDGKNIEDIKVGDYVESFNHKTNKIEKKKVLRLFKNKIKNDLVLTHLHNELIISTYSHPFYVKGRGYIPAYKLNKGDKIYANRTLHKKKKLSKSFLHYLWKRNIKFQSMANVQIQKDWKNLLFNSVWENIQRSFIFKKNVKKESNEKFRNEKKGFSYIKKDWTQTSDTRRKWSWDDNSTKKFIGKTWKWLVSRINSLDEKEKLGGVSTSLQSRFSKSIKNVGSGSRWFNSLFNFSEKKGQEKNRTIREIGVEGVEIYKQGNKYGLSKNSKNNFVYNIEVEGNNNYFANGILVHNCHACNAKGGQYEELIDYFGGKCLGLTATPYRLHAYQDFKTGQLSVVAKFLHRTRPRLFSKIIHITQVQELYRQKFLCPVEYEINPEYKHSELKLNSTGKNFDETSVASYNASHNIIEKAARIVVEELDNNN